MHLHLDIFGGIAGDMFIAALLDAWPEHADGMIAAIRAAGVPADLELRVPDHRDHVLCGKRFHVAEPVPHAHGEHEGHTSHRAIVRLLRSAPLAPAVASRAVAIFDLLARAESKVHGVDPDEVSFHEVGAWDSFADIVGAAYLIEQLAPRSWSASPIPLGGGRVATAHGPMPVPAPATAILLEGFTLADDGIPGERVTPTGAAILAHLRATAGAPRPLPSPSSLSRNGTGFGTRTLPGLSNVLRVLTFETASPLHRDENVGQIEFEVDDQTAEDLAVGIEALRGLPGVLDVIQIPATGKKGRLVAHVQVLCRSECLRETIDACFLQSTTIGLRWSIAARARLDRSSNQVTIEGRNVGVKLAARPGGMISAKAEIEDVQGPGGHSGRERRRLEAQAGALRPEQEKP